MIRMRCMRYSVAIELVRVVIGTSHAPAGMKVLAGS